MGCGKRWTGGKTVVIAEDNEKTTAFSGFHIALLAKQCIGVFYCDDTDTGFLGKTAFGWQFGVVWIILGNNIIPDLPV